MTACLRGLQVSPAGLTAGAPPAARRATSAPPPLTNTIPRNP